MEPTSPNPSQPRLGPHEEDFLGKLIRKKARQIICRTGTRLGDSADVEQQLRLKVEKHLSAYSDERGHLFAFLTAIVERQTASILRDQSAEKHVGRATVSLSIQVDVKGEGPVELAATIGQPDVDRRLELKSRSATEAFNLRQDIESMMAQLTPDERRVAESLQYGSVTQAERDLGIPRATIYDMLARWRGPFEDAGLREYL